MKNSSNLGKTKRKITDEKENTRRWLRRERYQRLRIALPAMKRSKDNERERAALKSRLQRVFGFDFVNE